MAVRVEKLLFRFRGGERRFGGRPVVMGILNVTPDSFSDGGDHFAPERALAHARDMIGAGAEIIDVGGESSRPGAAPVSAREEAQRVVPVIRALTAESNVLVSVDTVKAAVAEQAVAAGAAIINDISGLHADPRMLDVVRDTGAGCVLMHMRGTPQTMQQYTGYDDLIEEICRYFRKTLRAAEAAGVERDRFILDPGIGFSKTAEQNLVLLARCDEFRSLGRPILVGPSRKSFIGAVLSEPDPRRRIFGTAAATACAVLHGADIVRVHDVAEMRHAALVAAAIRNWLPPSHLYADGAHATTEAAAGSVSPPDSGGRKA
ncbi:MAG: dihydropteroate synthase [Kiritimatiellaeota bacterium]|nr:dihydropteroate synthase [Kiritimatiellota bacterium]